MSQTTLDRVLEDVSTLELSELGKVGLAVQNRLDILGYSLQEWNAMQSLVRSGVLKEIRPRYLPSAVDFTPVEILGEPLSETIIAERRTRLRNV